MDNSTGVIQLNPHASCPIPHCGMCANIADAISGGGGMFVGCGRHVQMVVHMSGR